MPKNDPKVSFTFWSNVFLKPLQTALRSTENYPRTEIAARYSTIQKINYSKNFIAWASYLWNRQLSAAWASHLSWSLTKALLDCFLTSGRLREYKALKKHVSHCWWWRVNFTRQSWAQQLDDRRVEVTAVIRLKLAKAELASVRNLEFKRKNNAREPLAKENF